MKHRRWLLLAVLIIAMLALGGCGVPRSGTDVMTTAPDGLWQSLVVWPLAKSLIWLDVRFRAVGMPYHWGFAIIAFTILIKIVTFPLTLMQLRGMQAQKDLQPKLQEIQKKYGKDREALSKAQMELYQEAGVNPLSGCLPLIVQMPILFGLYSALVALGPYLVNASFFWIPDLGFPEYTQGLSWLPEFFAAGEFGLLIAYLILPILLVVSQFAMQKWMTPTAGGDQAGMTKQISLMMTAMFGFFTLQVPAGLTLYWVTSNGIQMLQQWVITSDRFTLGSSQTPAEAIVEVKEAKPVTASANGAEPTAKPKRRRSKKR